MSDEIYLHIGAMKTGTSFLQGVLTANARRLRKAGVLVAPNRSAAVHDLVDFKAGGEERLDAVRGAWPQLVDTARDFKGRATVLSHEYLSLQGPERVDEIIASLRGLDVHVVLTVRDATGVLPAQWQTFARNRGTQTWPEYVAAARDERTKPRSHTFLHSQRIGKVVRIWRNKLGTEHVHVVTVPPPGAPRSLLWERFASVIGVDPASAPDLDVRSNPSAGYATAHLLCLVHTEVMLRGLPRSQAQRLAVFVADQAAPRRAQEPTPPLDEDTLRFAADWNKEVIRVLLRSRVELTGDIDDLPRKPDLSLARPLVPPPDDTVVEAARGAAETLAVLAPPGHGAGAWSSVDAAVSGVVDLMTAVIDSGGTDRLNARGTALLDNE